MLFTYLVIDVPRDSRIDEAIRQRRGPTRRDIKPVVEAINDPEQGPPPLVLDGVRGVGHVPVQAEPQREPPGQPDEVVPRVRPVPLLQVVPEQQERLHGLEGAGLEHLEGQAGPRRVVVRRLRVAGLRRRDPVADGQNHVEHDAPGRRMGAAPLVVPSVA